MLLTIINNECIAPDVYHMRLLGDTRDITRPGQFVQLKVPDFYLRRPISVCDFLPAQVGTLDLIYKAVGKGTLAMTTFAPNQTVDALLGLGNGYDTQIEQQAPLLLGGGVGVPPLFALAKELIKKGKTPQVILGFNKAEEIFWQLEFEALGVKTLVTTADGSAGLEGFVTDGMKTLAGQYDYVFTCGPEPMLKAVYDESVKNGVSGQFSFEERMACGFGACMGCSCKTKYGAKRICKDGPVLCLEEIIW